MNFNPYNLYHIYNQGNNRETLFRQSEDYLIFLKEIRLLLLPHCKIVAYCLMPNHFHLILYTDERVERMIQQGGLIIDPVTNGMRKLLSGYARIINKKYNRTGSLFRQKTKSKLLTEENIIAGITGNKSDYCANCFHYIHQNPWRAGLVKKLEDWEFSSFRDFAGMRNGNLCDKEIAGKLCNYDADDFMRVSYSEIVWSDRPGLTNLDE